MHKSRNAGRQRDAGTGTVMEDLFADIAYLAAGNERQQAAYRVLTGLGLLEQLASYNPILVGTIPLGIDIADSDLDIICQAADIPAWVTEVSRILKGMNITFQVELGEKNAGAQATVSFTHEHFPIELYAESTPSKQQNGYRHMLVEYRILQLLGPTAALCIPRPPAKQKHLPTNRKVLLLCFIIIHVRHAR